MSGGVRWDAAVVGAGPAGSAAAIVLARAGRRVVVLEKDRFPRPKVCGELLSGLAGAALDRLGVSGRLEALEPERIARGAVHLPGGGSAAFALPVPAWGVSRAALDDLLAAGAAQAGACVRFSTRVASVLPAGREGFRLRVASGEELEARHVVGAWGRWDALDRALERGFSARGRRYFGWSRDFVGETSALAGRADLYLFPGGYCGLSRVEGGAANLAGVVSAERYEALGGWPGVLESARRGNPALDAALAGLAPGPTGLRATGPVFFTAKPPSEAGILMAGDAAGVLDPFSGEGIATALASGILAAETLERALAADAPPRAAAREYARAWRRRFARPFVWGAVFRRLMLHPTLAEVAGRIAGERIVRLGLRALGK